jgi:hypothetical protein
MTINRDHDRDDDVADVFSRDETPGSWLAAAAAISVLIVATITLTLVAGGAYMLPG